MKPLTVRSENKFSTEYCLSSNTIEGLPGYEPSSFFFEITGPDAPQTAPNANSSIAAILPLAMSLGRDVHVAGQADRDFLVAMEECMGAWCRFRPDLFRPIRLTVDTEVAPRLPEVAPAIMAFSGGIDSTFALHAHKHGLVGRRTLDIRAAILVQGFDLPLQDEDAFEIARMHSRRILDSFGVRLNTVRTDWQKPFCVKWEMTHVLGLTAILHLFHNSFCAGVFADDFAYDAQWMPWSNNKVTNQMLGSSAFAVRSTGAEWSRTEKVAALAHDSVVLENLRVCYVHPELGGNCGHCEKCVRTRVNFHACGVDDVASLGGRLTVSDLEVLNPLNSETVLWYEDALAHGSWSAGDPIRRELQALVDRYKETVAVAPSMLAGKKQSKIRRMHKRIKRVPRALLHLFGVRTRR